MKMKTRTRNKNQKTGSMHDRTVRYFSDRLKGIEGLTIFRKEFEYKISNPREHGEVDNFGIYQRGKRLYCIIGESKSTDHYKARKKAKSQLRKDEWYIRQFYGENIRFFKFYITPKVLKRIK